MKNIYFLLWTIPVLFSLTAPAKGQTFEWTCYGTGTNVLGQTVTGMGIEMDAQGNRYIAGHFSHPIVNEGDTLYSMGGSGDIFAAKYDTAGALQWVVQAGGVRPDIGQDIAVDDNGNCYVTGTYQGTAYFDIDSIPGTIGVNQVFVAKYNSSGVFQWVARARAQGVPMKAAGIAVNNAGQVFVHGDFRQWAYFYNAGDSTASHSAQSVLQDATDVYTVSYNSGGQVQRARSAGPAGLPAPLTIDHAKAAATDESGNCYVTGNFLQVILFDSVGLVSQGDTDFYIAKYHSSGSAFGRPVLEALILMKPPQLAWTHPTTFT